MTIKVRVVTSGFIDTQSWILLLFNMTVHHGTGCAACLVTVCSDVLMSQSLTLSSLTAKEGSLSSQHWYLLPPHGFTWWGQGGNDPPPRNEPPPHKEDKFFQFLWFLALLKNFKGILQGPCGRSFQSRPAVSHAKACSLLIMNKDLHPCSEGVNSGHS